jgi:hypothetical protein
MPFLVSTLGGLLSLGAQPSMNAEAQNRAGAAAARNMLKEKNAPLRVMMDFYLFCASFFFT